MDYQQYNTAPGQFSGQQGGYLSNTPGVDGSPSSDGTKKGKSPSANQSLIPVTVKQLQLAAQALDDTFKLDGRELNQVTIVGSIVSIAEASTNLNFTVEDGTGKMEVKMWVDADEQQDYQAQKRAQWSEGSYVRVVGHLRSFNNKRNIVAFRINPLRDFNEMTFHLLEALHVHLLASKPAMQQVDGMYQQQPVYQQSSGQQWGGGVALPHFVDDLNNQVLGVVRSVQSPEGASVAFICESLHRSDAEVRNALDFLSGEAHVYCTIDDNHFQLAQQ